MDENKWYLDTTYSECKAIIEANIGEMSRSFIAIGYYLKHVRDREMYAEDGYNNIYDFAKDQYGLSRSTAARWMAMNDKFSKDGNSPILAEEFKNFEKSKLQEMLYLSNEQLEEVKENMTVREIRELRRPEPKPEPVKEDKPEPEPEETEGPDLEEADVGQAESMELGEVQTEIVPARAEPTRPTYSDLTSISDIIELSMRARVSLAQAGVNTLGDLKQIAYDRAITIRGMGQSGIDAIKRVIGDFAVKDCATSHTTETIEDEFTEEEENARAEIVIYDLLERKKKELDEWLRAFEGEKELPHPVEELKIIVGALANLVYDLEEMEEAEKAKQAQPELPKLKNNDQRKAFLDNYEEWPIWFKVPEANEVFYRYDLPDGTSLAIRKIRYWASWMENWSDESPDRVSKEYYILPEKYHYLHDCVVNRTAVIEKLKEVQNGKSKRKGI